MDEIQSSLKNIIENGENNRIEFKSEVPADHERFLKTVIAFSNCAGGRIIFGVKDDRSVIGIPEQNLFKIEDLITNSIIDSSKPVISPEVFHTTVDGKIVIVVDIRPGKLCPYRLKYKDRNRSVFVRINSTTRVADPDTVRSLEIRGTGVSYDSIERPDMTADRIAVNDLCKRLSKFKKEVTPQKLVSMDVVHETPHGYVPTNAFLLLTDNPAPSFQILCATFKGTSRVEFVDRLELDGDIVSQVTDAARFVIRSLKQETRFDGMIRIDRHEIPEDAIREAIVNAVVHRDYSLHGRDITVSVYSDRVEIESPGLPLGFDYTDPLSGYSSIRNQAIASVFRAIGFMEHYGMGIIRMFEACRDNGTPDPEFFDRHDSFVVRFMRGKIATEKPAGRPDSVLECIATNPRITMKDMSETLGISMHIVKKTISELKESGRISREGPSNGGYWKMN